MSQDNIVSGFQKAAEHLSNKIIGSMDAHLVESIISLFNSGVLVHYVSSPRTSVDFNNFKMTVEQANGVRFEAREKIVELYKALDELKAENERLSERYKNIELANKEWSRNDAVTFGQLITQNQELTAESDQLNDEIRKLNAMFVKETKEWLELTACLRDMVGALEHYKGSTLSDENGLHKEGTDALTRVARDCLAKHADLIGKLKWSGE